MSKTPYTNVTGTDLSTATQGTAITYSYDTSWTDKLISYNGQSIVYDSIGNPTTYRGATLTWNGRLLTSYEKGTNRFEYSYNEDGLRVEKKYYSNNTLNDICTYVWENGKLIAQKKYSCDNNNYLTITYLYDGEEAIGFVYDGLTFYYIKNIQGDVTAIAIADSGKLALTISYDAWGNPEYSIVVDDNAGVWEKLAAFLRAAGIMGLNNYTYRGYFYDTETGLYYLQSRYYDPEMGRFINLDSTDYAGYGYTPLSTNLFAYCENNPINNIDTKGNLAIASVAASYLFVISAAALVYAACTAILNQYNTTFGFQNSWGSFVNALNSYAYSQQYKITLASNVIWNWTKYRISTTAKSVQIAVQGAMADAKIRAKVNKNSKERYWKANLSSTLEYVTIGNGITFSEAVNEVKANRSVFCIYKSDARLVARRASKDLYGIDRYYEDDAHCQSKRFAYKHYHVYNHKKKAHIWYLFN